MAGTITHFRGRYLGIVERDGWEYATRTNARSVVVLVALTGGQELVLVEQFRIPVGARVIELPAGLVGDTGDADEPTEQAAQRELEEETGYRAGVLEQIMVCPSSAGLTDEILHFYLARTLQRVGPGGGDGSEDIQVHHVPLAGADRWLDERLRAGLSVDPKIYAALYWLGDHGDGAAPPTPAG